MDEEDTYSDEKKKSKPDDGSGLLILLAIFFLFATCNMCDKIERTADTVKRIEEKVDNIQKQLNEN